MSESFNWAVEFEKCENQHDLLKTGKAAAARITELELKLDAMQKWAKTLVQLALDP